LDSHPACCCDVTQYIIIINNKIDGFLAFRCVDPGEEVRGD